jgi:hypothetical protein
MGCLIRRGDDFGLRLVPRLASVGTPGIGGEDCSHPHAGLQLSHRRCDALEDNTLTHYKRQVLAFTPLTFGEPCLDKSLDDMPSLNHTLAQSYFH